MAILSKGFHLFGTAKVTLRSLTLFRCQFAKDIDPKKDLQIRRVYKLKEGGYRFEDSNINFEIFPAGSTLHIQNLFLSEDFGISVAFVEDQGKFDFSARDADLPQPALLNFLTLESEEVLPLCQATSDAYTAPSYKEAKFEP